MSFDEVVSDGRLAELIERGDRGELQGLGLFRVEQCHQRRRGVRIRNERERFNRRTPHHAGLVCIHRELRRALQQRFQPAVRVDAGERGPGALQSFRQRGGQGQDDIEVLRIRQQLQCPRNVRRLMLRSDHDDQPPQEFARTGAAGEFPRRRKGIQQSPAATGGRTQHRRLNPGIIEILARQPREQGGLLPRPAFAHGERHLQPGPRRQMMDESRNLFAQPGSCFEARLGQTEGVFHHPGRRVGERDGDDFGDLFVH